MINISDMFKFYSAEIKKEELLDFLKQTTKQEFPYEDIANFEINKDGVLIILKSGESISVDVDWEEFALR